MEISTIAKILFILALLIVILIIIGQSWPIIYEWFEKLNWVRALG